MNRQDAINALTQVKPELAGRFGVTSLALFGSTVRDEANLKSDIDILVTFDEPATSGKYFGVQFLLEDMFGCRIDLVTEKALRAEIRPFVKQEAIYV